MYNLKSIFLIVFLFSYSLLFSQIGFDKKFELNISGNHTFLFHIPVIPDNMTFKDNLAPSFKNKLGIRIKSKYIDISSYWLLNATITDTANIEDILSVLPLENKITINVWKLKIGLGLQYFDWGVADGINPTDNLNPKDLTKFISADVIEKKLSVLSASIDFYPIDQMGMQIVYIPFYQNDKLPQTDIPLTIPGGVEYVNPDFDFTSFIIGGKVNFYLPYIDFSFSYVYDVDPMYTPVIDVTMDNITYAPMSVGIINSIKMKHKRLHHFGTDFKVNVDRFGIWAEIAYTMTEDYLMDNYKIKNHELSWIGGFDFYYGVDDEFTFSFQYMGDYIPLFDQTFNKDYDTNDISFLNKTKSYYEEYYYRYLTPYLGGYLEGGLIQAFILHMKWPVLDKLLTPEITLLYSFPLLYDYDNEIKYGGIYVNPVFDIMPIDDLHIRIGAELFFSWNKEKDKNVQFDDNSKIGMFREESNIFVEVKFKWNFYFINDYPPKISFF